VPRTHGSPRGPSFPSQAQGRLDIEFRFSVRPSPRLWCGPRRAMSSPTYALTGRAFSILALWLCSGPPTAFVEAARYTLRGRSRGSDPERDSRSLSLAVAGAKRGSDGKWLTPDSFDGFSSGESNYDVDGDRGMTGDMATWEPTVQGTPSRFGNPAEWFDESMSGGPHAAWQTHYPALKDRIPQRSSLGEWTEGPGGRWVQGYQARHLKIEHRVAEMGPVLLPPSWFDESVQHVDVFGRSAAPSENSERFYYDWHRLLVSQNLSCSSPGCVASARLQVYNLKEQTARKCVLNLTVRHVSGGLIDWVVANGQQISAGCELSPSPCGSEERSPQHCLLDLDVDKLLGESGALNVSAKLADRASDDCKFQGSLLYATPSVKCFSQNLVVTAKASGANQTKASPPSADDDTNALSEVDQATMKGNVTSESNDTSVGSGEVERNPPSPSDASHENQIGAGAGATSVVGSPPQEVEATSSDRSRSDSTADLAGGSPTPSKPKAPIPTLTSSDPSDAGASTGDDEDTPSASSGDPPGATSASLQEAETPAIDSRTKGADSSTRSSGTVDSDGGQDTSHFAKIRDAGFEAADRSTLKSAATGAVTTTLPNTTRRTLDIALLSSA